MTELVKTEQTNKIMMPSAGPKDLMAFRAAMEDIIKNGLKEGDFNSGADYGKIPGTDKNVLFKAGAEKISATFRAFPKYTIIEKEVDHDRKNEYFYKQYRKTSVGFYRFVVNCTIVTREGEELGSSIGSCSTMESKYISRPRDMENTVLKMAQKRAFVAATLNSFGLSNAFTQDKEDHKENEAYEVTPIVEDPEPPKQKDQMTDTFDFNDTNQRSGLNKHMAKNGIPTNRFDELAKTFDGRPKTEVLQKIAELAKEFKQ